jgi:hypothetical protein
MGVQTVARSWLKAASSSVSPAAATRARVWLTTSAGMSATFAGWLSASSGERSKVM